jgi:hypothetical protein
MRAKREVHAKGESRYYCVLVVGSSKFRFPGNAHLLRTYVQGVSAFLGVTQVTSIK